MQTLLKINGSLNMVGYVVATIAPALGVAWIFTSVINGTAHQPEARGVVMSTAFISFAVVETPTIIATTLALVLQ